jgi:hypothetical protein
MWCIETTEEAYMTTGLSEEAEKLRSDIHNSLKEKKSKVKGGRKAAFPFE